MTSVTLPVATKHLELRLFQPRDVEGLMHYYTLPDVQRYIDSKARDRSDVEAALETLAGQVALKRPGDTLALAVERRSDKTMVGHLTMRWYDATAAQAELRLVFNPAFRRQGYASEAARAAIDLGFETFNFHRIFARCDARSAAAARLLKSLGMRLEAHYREHALFQGDWDEELHFAILDREWRRSPHIHEFGFHRVA